MNTEHILLIITTLGGLIKAYLEMKKAKAEAERANAEAERAEAESSRANEAEGLLVAAIEGVEEAKAEDPEHAKQLVKAIKKRTVMRGVDTAFNEVVQEVTKGECKVSDLTRRLSKTRMIQTLKEDELL